MIKLNCIYIERLDGEKDTIDVELQVIQGLNVGIVRQVVKRNERKYNENPADIIEKRKMDKQDKKLLKIIKKLSDKETLIVGNEKFVVDFSISNSLFEMKKRELLRNTKEIIQYLGERVEVAGRKTFLLRIDSDKWYIEDLKNILLEIKNFYENIYIYNSNDGLDMENLVDFFYDECGVVVHLLEGEQVEKLEVDTTLFLVKEWTKEYSSIHCSNGYVVAEYETGLVRKRKRFQTTKASRNNQGRKHQEICMGLVYTYCGKQITYELAVLITNHTFLKHLWNQCHLKNEISIVAIYNVEWYNS